MCLLKLEQDNGQDAAPECQPCHRPIGPSDSGWVALLRIWNLLGLEERVELVPSGRGED